MKLPTGDFNFAYKTHKLFEKTVFYMPSNTVIQWWKIRINISLFMKMIMMLDVPKLCLTPGSAPGKDLVWSTAVISAAVLSDQLILIDFQQFSFRWYDIVTRQGKES